MRERAAKIIRHMHDLINPGLQLQRDLPLMLSVVPCEIANGDKERRDEDGHERDVELGASIAFVPRDRVDDAE